MVVGVCVNERDGSASKVFFAKQAPQTGIKPHTDFTNFIMTSHLGLDCPPPPQSWMKVGEETQHWEDGKGMVAGPMVYSHHNKAFTRLFYRMFRRSPVVESTLLYMSVRSLKSSEYPMCE